MVFLHDPNGTYIDTEHIPSFAILLCDAKVQMSLLIFDWNFLPHKSYPKSYPSLPHKLNKESLHAILIIIYLGFSLHY